MDARGFCGRRNGHPFTFAPKAVEYLCESPRLLLCCASRSIQKDSVLFQHPSGYCIEYLSVFLLLVAPCVGTFCITSLFVTPILYFMSHQKSSIISKKPNKGRGVRFAPPYLSKREVPVGRVSRPTSKRSLPFRALLSKSKRVSLRSPFSLTPNFLKYPSYPVSSFLLPTSPSRRSSCSCLPP